MNDLQNTLPRRLGRRAMQTPDDTAFIRQIRGQIPESISWSDFLARARSLAMGLVNAGIGPGDVLGIGLANSLEWELVQHGGFMAGCIVAGLDMNDPPSRLECLTAAISPKVLVIPNARLLETLPPDLLSGVKVILAPEPGPFPDKRVFGIDDFIRRAPVCELPVISGRHTAILIFTSGTTGMPKPLTYTHAQLVLAATTIAGRLRPFLPEHPRSACWLPLSSPFQRMINYCAIELKGITYMVENPRDIMDSVGFIRPHFLAGVPRFFEKLYEDIQGKLDRLPKLVSRIITRMETAAGPPRRVPPGRKLLFRMADVLVFRRIRRVLGGGICFLISGSAPLNPAIPGKFLSWGWLLLESYGVSENILPVAMNLPDRFRPGTVGLPLPGNHIRIAGDGEILVRGKGVATSGVSLTKDHFLKTGDLGRLDRDGFLLLDGRKSDVFKLSTGRKISPSALETLMAGIPDVAHSVIYGAGRKFTVALVNIPEKAWHTRVAAAGSGHRARQALFREIKRACRSIPAYARPVDVVIVHRPFSADTGELTGNLKLRRGFVLEKYAAELDRLYRHADGTVPGRCAS